MKSKDETKGSLSIPEIVKQYVLDTCGRMPETEKEVNGYLDLINHAKEYQTSFVIERTISKKFMKRLGFRTTGEIKKDNPLK